MRILFVFLFVCFFHVVAQACSSTGDNKIMDEATAFGKGIGLSFKIDESADAVRQTISGLVTANLKFINTPNAKGLTPLMVAFNGFFGAVFYARATKNITKRPVLCGKQLFYWTEVIRMLLFYGATYGGLSADGKALERPNPFAHLALGKAEYVPPIEARSFGSGEQGILEIIDESNDFSRPYIETVLWLLVLQNGFDNFYRINDDLKAAMRVLYRRISDVPSPVSFSESSLAVLSAPMHNYVAFTAAASQAGPPRATTEALQATLKLAAEIADRYQYVWTFVAANPEILEPWRRLIHPVEYAAVMRETIKRSLPVHMPEVLKDIVDTYICRYPIFDELITFDDVRKHAPDLLRNYQGVTPAEADTLVVTLLY